MSVKEVLQKVAVDLRDDAGWDEAMERIDVLRHIEEGLAEIRAGRSHSQEEAEAIIQKCCEK